MNIEPHHPGPNSYRQPPAKREPTPLNVTTGDLLLFTIAFVVAFVAIVASFM